MNLYSRPTSVTHYLSLLLRIEMHFSLLLGLGGALLASARPLGSGSTVKRSLPQVGDRLLAFGALFPCV